MDEPTQVDDVVVVGRRPDGNYFMWFPMVNQSYIIDQQRYDQLVDGGAGGPTVIDVDSAIDTAVDVFVQLLELLKKFPVMSTKDVADLDNLINQINEAQQAYAITGIRSDYEGAVEDALEFFYEAAGDILIGYVVGTLMGTAAAAGSFELGPGALAVGLGALAIGAGMSAIWPADDLAELTAGAIFGAADAIDALERGLGAQVQDGLFDMYRDVQDWIFRNAPSGPVAAIDGSAVGVITGTTENGLTTYAGTASRDNVSFTAAAAAITVDMALAGSQNTGGGGAISLLTIDGVFGSAFNDTILGNGFDNVLAGEAGNDHLDGRDGFDFADYGRAASAVVVNLGLSTQNTQGAGVDTLVNIEGVKGSAFNDTLTGDAAANTLYGAAGDDTINAGGGDDIIFANGVGPSAGTEYNVIDGGAGVDMVSYELETRDLKIDLNSETFGWGGQVFADALAYPGFDRLFNIEDVTGGRGNDHILGNSGANRLLGGEGRDLISGGDGDDWIEGGEGDDMVDGGAGYDFVSYLTSSEGVTIDFEMMDFSWWFLPDYYINFEGIVGSRFDDSLTGNATANEIYGGDGQDTVDGKAGNDTLVGGRGADLLTGGAGADIFLFQDADDSTSAETDAILDFQNGSDLIDLSGFWDGSAAGVAFAVRDGSTFIEIDLDLDGEQDFQLELRGVTSGIGFEDLLGGLSGSASTPMTTEDRDWLF